MAIHLGPLDGVNEKHALLVVEASETTVTVYDPSCGERHLIAELFRASWSLRHNMAILVAR